MIDIIIPFHNNKYIWKCLGSLINTTDKSIVRLILIKSGLEDIEYDISDFAFDHHLNYIYKYFPENIGWCRGLNEGIKLSKNRDYILWCNDDILFSEGWVQKMLNHFHDEQIGAVGPTSNYTMGRQKVEFNYGLWEEPANFLIGFFLLFRREVIEDIGEVDEGFGIGGSEEIDYAIRLKQKGYKMVIARDVFIHHFGSKTLWNYVGGTTEAYNEFILKKDKILREKWGNEIVNEVMSGATPLTIGWGIPMRTNYIHRKFAVSCVFLKKPGIWHWIEAPKGLIHDSRNAIVQEALDYNCNYVFFTDDDHKLYPDTFVSLYNHMIQNPEVKIVGALAFKSRGNPLPCIFRTDGDFYTPILDYSKGLIEVDGIGMACTLIDIEVFKNIQNEPWYEIKKYGEDLDFCRKAKKAGYKIFCDTAVIAPHLGDSIEVTEDDYIQWRKISQIDFGVSGPKKIF